MAERRCSRPSGTEHVHVAKVDLRGGSPTAWQITALSLAESGTFNDPYARNVLVPFWRQVAAQPAACRLEIEVWEDGPEFALLCVYEPGCPTSESCGSWSLAMKQAGIDADLVVTPNKIEGYQQATSVTADLSPSGVLTGTIVINSEYSADNTVGTLTVTFTATFIR